MARFLKPAQQQIVDMTSQPMAPFYISLMEKAQQNLDKATGMKMEYIDKINQTPIFTDEDRKATVGLAEEKLSEALKQEFINPNRLANTLMEVNREIAPGIQALKAKAQAGEMYDKMRIQWGANALLGDDPRNLSIKDDAGSWRGLNAFRAVGMNKEDIRKDFLQSANNYLTEVREEKVPTDVAGYYRFKKTTGLQDPNMFKTGSEKSVEFAERYIQTNPQILDIFKGNPEEAKNYLMQEFESAAGAYTPKEEYDRLINPYDKPTTGGGTGKGAGDKYTTELGRYAEIPDVSMTNALLDKAQDYKEASKKYNNKVDSFGEIIQNMDLGASSIPIKIFLNSGFYVNFDNIVKNLKNRALFGTSFANPVIEQRKESPILNKDIEENKKVYEKAETIINSGAITVPKEYGFGKIEDLNEKDKKRLTTALFYDILAQETTSNSAIGVGGINYAPSEIPLLTPDLKRIIMPKLKELAGDDGKSEALFNGSSLTLLPSRGKLVVTTSLPDTPTIDIDIKDLDVGLGYLADFSKKVNLLNKDKIKLEDERGFVYYNVPKYKMLSDYVKSDKDSVLTGVLAVRKEKDGLYEYLLDGEGNIQKYKDALLKRKVNTLEYDQELITTFENTFKSN
jgi:putative transposon-encoded protein